MRLADSLRARLGRRLERGDPSLPAQIASRTWGALASRALARPLVLPGNVRLIGVGSAVLGGAGKTPLAIALALELARRGERVSLLGHAYRAHPREAKVVDSGDDPAEVGDDALCCARALVGTGVAVIVAPSRQRALDHAATLGARVVVADGLLQSTPRRLAAAILVLDAGAPWGSGACPPAGDLRAPRAALLRAADHCVVIGPSAELPPGLPAGALAVTSRIDGASAPGLPRRSVAELTGVRTGLFLTVARPDRILAALRRAGVEPSAIIALADHASPSPRDLALASRAPVDLWLTTARCAVKLPRALGGAPVLALEHLLDVRTLVDRLLPFC